MNKNVKNSKKSETNFSECVKNNNEQWIDLSDLNAWKTLQTTAYEHQQFSIDQLRLLARFRDSNGLGAYCKKIGKRIYLHDAGFALWISNQ